MFKQVDSNIDFPEMEKKWLKHWSKTNLTDLYLKKNEKSDKYFSFLDGPITANNPMGVHHAWGRTYKDLWPKFFNLLGYRQRFQNGFDCQGLWVEVEVEKELKLKTKKDIENMVPGKRFESIAKFVDLCKARVQKFSAIQTKQSKRLGYFADWDNSYFTMSPENNYMIWLFLKKCFEAGWIYKGKESVPWCPRCETAISQHEMLTEDYKEVYHESVFFALPIKGRKNENLLVWTTTPWTIPANVAVAVDSEVSYCLVRSKNEQSYWVAEDLVKSVFKAEYEIIKTVKGNKLSGLKYEGPFDDLPAVSEIAKENPDTFHIVFETDSKILPITTVEGTGMVHTAVSAGVEDFKMGKKIGLPMIPVICDNASYLDGFGFLSKKNAKKHPELILNYLKENKNSNNVSWCFSILNYKHRYPACWRCKTELVWKVADEWYIAMDKKPANNSKGKSKTLRQMMIDVAKKIVWMPGFGLERELDWLKNMHDWLISKKNRYWGLALPIYECASCKHFEVYGSKEELKEKAVIGWKDFEGHTPHKPYIDKVKVKCSRCGATVERIDDVGNPWLDAGIVAYSTIKKNNKGEPLYLFDKKAWRKWFPADFITESFPGQFKNWFYALIAMSTVMENEPPFRRVLGFATQLGEDGRPMHKSWGNAIEFSEGADKIGVDVMRWMFARQNPAENMLFGYKKADEVRRQFYLMLWNVYKFFVEYANLDGFSVKNNSGKTFSLKNILDKWILARFAETVLFVEKKMKEYDAREAALSIEKLVLDISTWYIRRSRDRIWVSGEDADDKKCFYETLYYILANLSIVLSPFMPFVSEEMYSVLIGKKSVHLASWPLIDKKLIDEKLLLSMKKARDVVEAGHAKRKILNKKVRTPLLVLDLTVEGFSGINDSQIWETILNELNVKNVVVNTKYRYPKKENFVTEEDLEKEGRLRDLIRTIQSKRKELLLTATDRIDLTVSQEFIQNADFIKKRVLASKIVFGNGITVKKTD